MRRASFLVPSVDAGCVTVSPRQHNSASTPSLPFAFESDVERDLFLRGSEQLPFSNEVRPVKKLIELALTGQVTGLMARRQQPVEQAA